MSNKKEDREITFENYRYVVDAIVNTRGIKMPPCLEKDDLRQIGYIALLDIIKQYDPKNKKHKGKFGGYAYYLVYFRILDELRRVTKIRRRKGEKEFNPMRTGMYSECSYFTPTLWANGELKEVMTLFVSNLFENPLNKVQELLDIPLIREEVYDSLNDRERVILYLYTEYEKTLKEIGMIIGVGESRTSQIYTKIKRKTCHILQKGGYGN